MWLAHWASRLLAGLRFSARLCHRVTEAGRQPDRVAVEVPQPIGEVHPFAASLEAGVRRRQLAQQVRPALVVRPADRVAGIPEVIPQHAVELAGEESVQGRVTPRRTIERLNLRRPIYKEPAGHRHFGRERPEFTRERTDQTAALNNEAAGLVRVNSPARG